MHREEGRSLSSQEVTEVQQSVARVSWHAQSVVRLRGCPGFWDRDSGMTGSQAQAALAETHAFETRGQGITIKSEKDGW